MHTIRMATRASKLALIQTEYISKMISALRGDVNTATVTISTKGDRDKTDFIYKTGSVGVFTSEVENALLDGRADLAVHSLKDLPTRCTEGLVIAAIPKRQSVADVLVAGGKVRSIEELPSKATVGTSSLRRIGQLCCMRKDLRCCAMRGNVETRVNKVASGAVDAIIVAQAGLNRLGMADKVSAVLAPGEFLPAPGQGALAVQIRADDNELMELISQIDDKNARITAETERGILAVMHGGCSIPLGAYAQILGDTIKINAMICDVKGEKHIKRSLSCRVEDAEKGAAELAQELLEAGGREILREIATQTG